MGWLGVARRDCVEETVAALEIQFVKGWPR